MCRGYFSSQEIDPHHATEHRSTDQSRNGCGMCCFCHAQPFEITRAKNIKNPRLQRSCQNAEVVEAFCSRRVHHRDRHQHTIPIALAALPGATLPRLRALALFGRRPPQRVDSLLMPASENLHIPGSRQSRGFRVLLRPYRSAGGPTAVNSRHRSRPWLTRTRRDCVDNNDHRSPVNR